MKTSLKGHQLPESHGEAKALLTAGKLTYLRCHNCDNPLTWPRTATSPAGWRETQISGLCEPCFDNLTSFEEDE